jgi:hypothetical protein
MGEVILASGGEPNGSPSKTRKSLLIYNIQRARQSLLVEESKFFSPSQASIALLTLRNIEAMQRACQILASEKAKWLI